MMNTGTYGLGTSIRGPGAGAAGPGLAGFGHGQHQTASSLLGRAAEEETQRNMKNKALEQQDKQGKAMLGATLGAAGVGIAASQGAIAGAWGGPLGMAIGGLIGAVGASLF